ncbi:sensor histidine kinase [Paenibacillus massiliensis]|uniref:sensor histidine kinase n=1 Tax=Paenibacillus massiliensis TaxID=225917 RepID=UPI00048BBD0C|nr:histidine kinase [Paenibacillus massiliensis]
MKNFFARWKYNGLFNQIFIVTVISIITVSVLTSLVTIRMSERLFIDTFSITNSKILTQIRSSFESFNDTIVNAASQAGQSLTVKNFLTEGPSDSTTTSRSFFNMGQQMDQINSNVDAYNVKILVTGRNGRISSTGQTYWSLPIPSEDDYSIITKTMEHPRRVMYQYDEEQWGDLNDHFIVASKALMERTTGVLYGGIYVAIREQDFKQFYTNFTSAGNDIVVLNAQGRVVSSNRDELIGQYSVELREYASEIRSDNLKYKNADFMGTEYIVLSTYIPAYDFYLVNLIDRQVAAGQIIDVNSILLICLAIVGIAVLLVFLISQRLTNSLTRLVRQMSRITEKDFHNYIDVSGSYEVKELGRAYNYMLDELNDYIQKLMETQKEVRNAELAALQRQINPHFLYNTLASIKMLVQRGNKETASETINALISLLQNTISNVSETITIEQELVNMKNYVFINHVRYGDRIKVNYFVAPDCMHFQVPKLIIQPFIENAFFHAFNEKPGGTIYILVSSDRDRLIIEVVDNGDGMDELSNQGELPNPKSKRQLFTGIGVQNVNNRIALLYGEQYGVAISSTKGEGTKVKITLPQIE